MGLQRRCRKMRKKVWIRITVKYCSASSWSFSSFSWPPTSCFSLENNQQSVNRCCWPTTHRAGSLSSDGTCSGSCWSSSLGLTCVAPGSACPGSASCPAGDSAPASAVSLRSKAPTPAGSASSARSGSDSSCGSPAPAAVLDSLPKRQQKTTTTTTHQPF